MKKEYVFAGISIGLWSTMATVSKLLLGSLDSIQVLAVSSLFASFFLFLLNLFKGNLKMFRKYKVADYLQMAGIGLLGTFAYYLFLYKGMDRLLASQGFIINYLWPIMTVFFACVILKEKLTVRKVIAIVMSFVGVIIVAGNGNLFGMDKNSLTGVLCCVIAAASYGLFSVLNKYKNYDKFFSMMIYNIASTFVSFGYLFLSGLEFVPGGIQALGLAWIGIFTSAIAYTTWALALERGDTAKISNLAYITPFLSLVWTSLILREPFSIYSVAGLLVIVLGIFIQMKKK